MNSLSNLTTFSSSSSPLQKLRHKTTLPASFSRPLTLKSPSSTSSLTLRHHPHHPHLHHRRRLAISASSTATVTTWTSAPLSLVTAVDQASTHFHVSVDLSSCPDLVAAYTIPGQYVKLRFDGAKDHPIYLAMANTPAAAANSNELLFLVTRIAGTTSDLLCGLSSGDLVEVTSVLGNGFETDKLPADEFPALLLFALDSGIGAVSALIETGIDAAKRSDVRLYYGSTNQKTLVYHDKFEKWESTGVKVIPVLSQPDEGWDGETGEVQDAYSRANKLTSPPTTGAVLCGESKMITAVSTVLVADGVSKDSILSNY